MTDLSGKTALITGSSRGIGKAIAERYAALGARVVVNYASSAKEADDLVAAIAAKGGEAIAVQGDVSKRADVGAIFQAAVDRFGGIDIAVVSAGLELVDTPLVDTKEEDFDRLFAVNTKGAFLTLQAAARLVRDKGRIIYIGSSTTSLSLPGAALYGGSKMAPRYFVEVLAKEIAHRGVTVNSIIPTAIEGAGIFTQGLPPAEKERISLNRPMGRVGTVEDVANAAEYFASPLSAYVSGQHLLLSGGADQ